MLKYRNPHFYDDLLFYTEFYTVIVVIKVFLIIRKAAAPPPHHHMVKTMFTYTPQTEIPRVLIVKERFPTSLIGSHADNNSSVSSGGRFPVIKGTVRFAS